MSSDASVFNGEKGDTYSSWLDEVNTELEPRSGVQFDLWQTKTGDDPRDFERDADATAVPPIVAVELTDAVAKQIAHAYYFERMERMSEAIRVKFEKADNMRKVMRKDRLMLFQFLYKNTSGNAREEIRKLKADRVHQIKPIFDKYYGQQEENDRQAIERLLDDGYSNEEGNKFVYGMDMTAHIQGFEFLVNKAKGMVSVENRAEYPYSQPEKMAKMLVEGLPTEFTELITTLRITGAARSHAGDADDLGGLVEFSESELKLPAYGTLKTLLITLDTKNKAAAKKAGSSAMPSFAGMAPGNSTGSGRGANSEQGVCWHYGTEHGCRNGDRCRFAHHSQSLNHHSEHGYGGKRGTGSFSGCCWDCGEAGVKRGHQGCKSPGSGNFKKVLQQQAGKGKGKSKGGGKGGKAFLTKAQRRQSKKSKQRESARDKLFEMIQKDSMGSSSDEDKEPSKKKKKTEMELLIKQATRQKGSMLKVLTGTSRGDDSIQRGINITEDLRLEQETQRVKMLSHSMNARKYVCYDTGSGVTATTLIQDVTHIDTSRAALQGYEVEGIGGAISKPKAKGTAVFATRATPGSSLMLSFDPDSTVLNKTDKRDNDVRVISGQKMKAMGMRLLEKFYNGKDIVIHESKTIESGEFMILGEHDGILALDTINQRASNYANNKKFQAAVALCKAGVGPPYVFIEDPQPDKVEKMQQNFSCGAFSHGTGGSSDGRSSQQITEQAERRTTSSRGATAEVSRLAIYISSHADIEKENEELELSCILGSRPDQEVYYSLMATKRYQIYIVNESKLKPEQRARLWHWRLAHCGFAVPFVATKQKLVEGVEVTVCLNEDCAICDQAKFRRGSFPRKGIEFKVRLQPYHTVHVDGFGFLGSMKVKSYSGDALPPSYHGAKGGYVIVDGETGDIAVKLAALKSQFPRLLKQYLIGVLAMDWIVRRVVLDNAGELISHELQALADEYEFELRPGSPYTPQDNSLAEAAVKKICTFMRVFMLGAPHLPANRWGLAAKYASKVNLVTPSKDAVGGKQRLTVYEKLKGRAPNPKKMFYKIFGAPCQYKIEGKKMRFIPKHGSKTANGSFVGVEFPSVLVDDYETKKVIKISHRKVRVYEGAYCVQPHVNIDSLKQLLEVAAEAEAGEELEIPVSVPSVLSLDSIHELKQSDQEVKPVPLMEDNKEIETASVIERMEELKAEYDQLKMEPSLKDKIIGKLDHEESEDVEKVQTRSRTPAGAAEGKEEEPEASSCYGAMDEGLDEEEVEGQLVQRRKKKSKKKHDTINSTMTVGDRVKTKSTMFDGDKPGSFSENQPEYQYGKIKARKKDKFTVKWDTGGTLQSHKSHLELVLAGVNRTNIEESKEAESESPKKIYLKMAMVGSSIPPLNEVKEPYRTLIILADIEKLREEYENEAGRKYPKNFWDSLTKEDWREFVLAVRKENNSWVATGATKTVRWEDMEPGVPIIDLGELYLIKRDLTHKFRQYARGDQLKAGVDYKETFSATVSASTIQLFFAMGTAFELPFRGGDVGTAYLQGKQRKPVYCYKPSYADLIDLPWDKLAELRQSLLKILRDEGRPGFNRFVKAAKSKGRQKEVWQFMKAVYGIPDAGNEWALERDHKLCKILKFRKSQVDQCIYWKIGTIDENLTFHDRPRLASTFIDKGIEMMVMLSWVDDLPYFSTEKMNLWYKKNMAEQLPMTFFPVLTDFVSIEVKQDLERGTTELTQTKYWMALKRRFSKFLPEVFQTRVPMPGGTTLSPPAEGEHEEAKNLPYAELVGAMNFAACHTKRELRYYVSILSRYMSNWTVTHWKMALQCLQYGITTKNTGVIYSAKLDPHGVSVLSAYADANFTNPANERSGGCSIIMMNGAAIHVEASQHSTVKTSTTDAELTESFRAAKHIMGFRNILAELGMGMDEPTVLYQDCQPAIQVANNSRNLTNSTKFMDVRVFKVREFIEDQEIRMKYTKTCEMVADIGTKCLPRPQFEFLRDIMNGYALVEASKKNQTVALFSRVYQM